MRRIVLAGRDWQSRALLRAQLIEEGFEVEAHDSIENALASLRGSRNLPALILADVSKSERPAEDAEQLKDWSKVVPIWLLASRNALAEEALGGQTFEKVLFRPLGLGPLVDQVKRRLERKE